MIIAVDIQQSSSPSHLAAYITTLAAQQPGHRFILFSVTNDLLKPLPANCEWVAIKPRISNSVLLHFWYNYRLPSLLKKYDASVFVSENNVGSLRSTVPHLMLMKDAAILQPHRLKFANKRYLKKYFSGFVARAAGVLASTPANAHLFAKHCPTEQQKLKTIFYGLAPQYKKLDYEIVESIREQHTRGHAYFVAECNRSNQPQ
ncbi:MAG: hypothetical protein EOO03_01935, partial [Chitinophagaceae bacterium]